MNPLQSDQNGIDTARIVRDWQHPMYNLARRMLGNDEDARDATQEIFLKVLRGLHTYDASKPLKPWIYKLAINEIVSFKRRLCRTRKKEETMVFPPTDPRKQNELMLEEAKEVVRTAVGQLPETLKSVLVLHYFQGLNQVEVAETLGLPRTTVRSRIEKALDTIRLGVQGSGVYSLGPLLADPSLLFPDVPVPQALSTKLTALAARGVIPAAAGAGSATLIGMMIMKKNVILALFLLFLLCLGTGFIVVNMGMNWSPGTAVPTEIEPVAEYSETPSAVNLPKADMDDPGLPPSSEPGDSSAENAPSAVNTESSLAVLRGRVLDMKGRRGIPGARVFLCTKPTDWPWDPPGDGKLFTTVTDEEGRYILEVDAEGGCSVAARAKGYALPTLLQQYYEVGLHGSRLKRHKEEYQKLVETVTRLKSEVHLTPGTSQQKDLFLTKSEARIHGRVTDEDGVVLEGALISTGLITMTPPWGLQMISMGPLTCRSDAMGNFDFGFEFVPGTYRFTVSCPGYQSSRVSVSVPDFETLLAEITVPLKKLKTFKGRVVDEAGHPVGGVLIYLEDGKSVHATAPEDGMTKDQTIFQTDFSKPDARSDDQGCFALSLGQCSGLVLFAKGFVPARFPEPKPGMDVNITLKSGKTVRGRIVDDRGVPIAGAHVFPFHSGEFFIAPHPFRGKGFRIRSIVSEIAGPRYNFQMEVLFDDLDALEKAKSPPLYVRSDDSGFFEFKGVSEEGKTQFFVFHKASHLYHIFHLHPKDTTPRWVLERRPMVRINATDSSGKPIKKFNVSHSQFRIRGTGTNGTCEFLAEVRQVNITIKADGFKTKTIDLGTLAWGEVRNLSVVLDERN